MKLSGEQSWKSGRIRITSWMGSGEVLETCTSAGFICKVGQVFFPDFTFELMIVSLFNAEFAETTENSKFINNHKPGVYAGHFCLDFIRSENVTIPTCNTEYMFYND